MNKWQTKPLSKRLQPPSWSSSHVTAACFCHVTSSRLSVSPFPLVPPSFVLQQNAPSHLRAWPPHCPPDPGAPGERPHCRRTSTFVSLWDFARVSRTSRSRWLPGRPQRSKPRLGGSGSATEAAWARGAANLRSARGTRRGWTASAANRLAFTA